MSLKLALLALAFVVLGATRQADACALQGTNPVVFGNYDVYSNTDLEVMGGVKYVCVLSLTIRVELSRGQSSSYAMRTMKAGGTDALQYQLYADAAKTQVWGNGTSGTVIYGPYIGLLTATTIPIYAVIPKKQNVATGSYTDTVVVTLNY